MASHKRESDSSGDEGGRPLIGDISLGGADYLTLMSVAGGAGIVGVRDWYVRDGETGRAMVPFLLV